MSEDYRTKGEQLRVLFCLGVSQEFFSAPPSQLGLLVAGFTAAFDDLAGRFGLTVLGTFDDDEMMVGPSTTWPWTAYILADAPNLQAVTDVCNVVRETEIGDDARLWKYLRIEARVGRALFTGNA